MVMTLKSPSSSDFKSLSCHVLCSKTCQYTIVRAVGEGQFGVVNCCKVNCTEERVAVKMIGDYSDATREADMMKKLSLLDPDENNLVRFFEYFRYNNCNYLVYELLDQTLHSFMLQRGCIPLSLAVIRIIISQLLVALKALKSIGVLHGDIKPDNIMFVNHRKEPYRVKLIDFGMALSVSKCTPSLFFRPLCYRAIEIYLGLQITEAIDMWSLGCIMALLYIGNHLYSPECEYDVVRNIVTMQGQPSDAMLNVGSYTHKFFIRNNTSTTSKWRLKTKEEYNLYSRRSLLQRHKAVSDTFTTLDDLTKYYSKPGDSSENEKTYISLLKLMLEVDAELRISPSDALGHPFITMGGFSEEVMSSSIASTRDGKTTSVDHTSSRGLSTMVSFTPKSPSSVAGFSVIATSVVPASTFASLGSHNVPEQVHSSIPSITGGDQASSVPLIEMKASIILKLEDKSLHRRTGPIKRWRAMLKRVTKFFGRCRCTKIKCCAQVAGPELVMAADGGDLVALCSRESQESVTGNMLLVIPASTDKHTATGKLWSDSSGSSATSHR